MNTGLFRIRLCFQFSVELIRLLRLDLTIILGGEQGLKLEILMLPHDLYGMGNELE